MIHMWDVYLFNDILCKYTVYVYQALSALCLGFSGVIIYNKINYLALLGLEISIKLLWNDIFCLHFIYWLFFYGFPPNLNQFQNKCRKYDSGGQSWHCFCQNFMISLLICWPKLFYCSLLLFTMLRWQLFILAFDYLYSCLCFYDMFTMSIYQ